MKKQEQLFRIARENAPTVVVENMKQAQLLASYMTGEKPALQFLRISKINIRRGSIRSGIYSE